MEALDTKYEDLKVWLKSPEDRLLRCVSSTNDNAPHINAARKGSSIHVSKEKSTTLQPGDSFEREGTTFQMFRIYEAVSNLGTNSIAVAYFDKDGAAADGKTLKHFYQLSRSFEDSNFEVPTPPTPPLRLFL